MKQLLYESKRLLIYEFLGEFDLNTELKIKTCTVLILIITLPQLLPEAHQVLDWSTRGLSGPRTISERLIMPSIGQRVAYQVLDWLARGLSGPRLVSERLIMSSTSTH